MRPANLRLLAECGPYTVASLSNGLLMVTPTQTGGVITRVALARAVQEALNTLTTHPRAQRKAPKRKATR